MWVQVGPYCVPHVCAMDGHTGCLHCWKGETRSLKPRYSGNSLRLREYGLWHYVVWVQIPALPFPMDFGAVSRTQDSHQIHGEHDLFLREGRKTGETTHGKSSQQSGIGIGAHSDQIWSSDIRYLTHLGVHACMCVHAPSINISVVVISLPLTHLGKGSGEWQYVYYNPLRFIGCFSHSTHKHLDLEASK